MRGRIEVFFALAVILSCGAPAFAGDALDNEGGEAGWIMLATVVLSPPSPIARAAYAGDLEAIKDILKQDPGSINAVGGRGMTALIVAAKKGDLEMVRFLFDKGADLHACSHHGTALSLAADNNWFDIVKFLIDSGAELNNAGGSCQAPLISVARLGRQEMVRFLLEHGADPNVKNPAKYTPLHGTTDLDVAKLLIKYGANVHVLNRNGYTPVEYAIMFDHQDLAIFMIKSGKRKHSAARQKMIQMQPWYLLGLAYEHRRLDVVAFFLDDSRILFEMIESDPQFIQSFVMKGLNVNVRDDDGKTLLMRAVTANKVEVVRMLVELRADINAQVSSNKTALTFAAAEGLTHMVSLLIDAGADIGVMDKSGRRPIDYAREKGHADIVKLLDAAGAK